MEGRGKDFEEEERRDKDLEGWDREDLWRLEEGEGLYGFYRLFGWWEIGVFRILGSWGWIVNFKKNIFS